MTYNVFSGTLNPTHFTSPLLRQFLGAQERRSPAFPLTLTTATTGWMTYGQLRADCLYTGISSGPNARYRVWEAFTFYLIRGGVAYGNVVGRINEVTLRRARLVLGWVTVFGG